MNYNSDFEMDGYRLTIQLHAAIVDAATYSARNNGHTNINNIHMRNTIVEHKVGAMVADARSKEKRRSAYAVTMDDVTNDGRLTNRAHTVGSKRGKRTTFPTSTTALIPTSDGDAFSKEGYVQRTFDKRRKCKCNTRTNEAWSK